jgi:hypothetical protein
VIGESSRREDGAEEMRIEYSKITEPRYLSGWQREKASDGSRFKPKEQREPDEDGLKKSDECLRVQVRTRVRERTARSTSQNLGQIWVSPTSNAALEKALTSLYETEKKTFLYGMPCVSFAAAESIFSENSVKCQ